MSIVAWYKRMIRTISGQEKREKKEGVKKMTR
jgi:hypothetical protein